MSDQDTYASAPSLPQKDKVSPIEERVLREAKLVYDDIFGEERLPHSPTSKKKPGKPREFSQGRRRAAAT